MTRNIILAALASLSMFGCLPSGANGGTSHAKLAKASVVEALRIIHAPMYYSRLIEEAGGTSDVVLTSVGMLFGEDCDRMAAIGHGFVWMPGQPARASHMRPYGVHVGRGVKLALGTKVGGATEDFEVLGLGHPGILGFGDYHQGYYEATLIRLNRSAGETCPRELELAEEPSFGDTAVLIGPNPDSGVIEEIPLELNSAQKGGVLRFINHSDKLVVRGYSGSPILADTSSGLRFFGSTQHTEELIDPEDCTVTTPIRNDETEARPAVLQYQLPEYRVAVEDLVKKRSRVQFVDTPTYSPPPKEIAEEDPGLATGPFKSRTREWATNFIPLIDSVAKVPEENSIFECRILFAEPGPTLGISATVRVPLHTDSAQKRTVPSDLAATLSSPNWQEPVILTRDADRYGENLNESSNLQITPEFSFSTDSETVAGINKEMNALGSGGRFIQPEGFGDFGITIDEAGKTRVTWATEAGGVDEQTGRLSSEDFWKSLANTQACTITMTQL